MHKSGAQLRTWRNRVKAKYYMKDVPLEEQKTLKDTQKDENRSTLNKNSRVKRLHNHTAGSKSVARIRSEQEIILQRPPTRAKFFKLCYRKKDGSYSDDVNTVLKNISNKERENPNTSMNIVSRNDLLTQAMGKDKNGRVRMMGAGVCPSLVFNDRSSRGPNQMLLIKSLEEQNIQLLAELNQLKTSQQISVATNPEQVNTNNDSIQATDLMPIMNVAERHNWELNLTDTIENTMSSQNIQIGDQVCLKSIINPLETVVVGLLYSNDPSTQIDDKELGADNWEIYVQVVMKPNERLPVPYRQYKSMRQTIGDYTAWPKCFVNLEDVDHRIFRRFGSSRTGSH